MKKIYCITLILSFTTALNAQCWNDYSVGRYFAAVIKTDGTLWSWGDNDFGQLGDGTNIPQNNPIQIGTDADWKTISLGVSHVAAIKADGTLWTWGLSICSQLGNNSYEPRSNPTQVGTETNWETVGVGGDYTVALKTDGTLWAWGYNSNGQLGIGPGQSFANIPIQIGQDADWETFSTGSLHTLAIKENGSLWAWGSNYHGALGTGINTLSALPIQISQTYDWKSVSASEGFSSAALKTDGSLWTWGNNWDGQLGNGTFNADSIPTQVGADFDWTAIGTADFSMSAVKSDGTLWSWGNNHLGCFGDGTTASSTIPRQIGTDTNWERIKINSGYTLAGKSDGSLWQIGIRYLTYAVEQMNMMPEEINCSMVTSVTVPFCAYPNPVNDQLNFQNTTDHPIEEIIISTQTGVILIDLVGDIYQVDVSSLNPGIYNLTIVSAGEDHYFNIYKN